MAKQVEKGFKLIKGAVGVAFSPDAKEEGNREIDLKHATQSQLEFLFDRNHPYVIKG